MKRVLEIIYYEAPEEYIAYFEMDGYCGHKKMIKMLNMIHYCGHLMTDEDYKELVKPNYIPYEIIEIRELQVHKPLTN